MPGAPTQPTRCAPARAPRTRHRRPLRSRRRRRPGFPPGRATRRRPPTGSAAPCTANREGPAMSVPYSARAGLRADQLADLDTLRVTLPGPVAGAIRAYRASLGVLAERPPQPGTLAAEAAAAEARQQARAAAA